jgi:hypothetical protein
LCVYIDFTRFGLSYCFIVATLRDLRGFYGLSARLTELGRC